MGVASEERDTAERTLCPRCGTPADPAQEYCLSCGLRLPVVGGPELGNSWRRRLRRYPGDWLWPALLFLLIAVLGAAIAILVVRREPRSALVATNNGLTGVSPGVPTQASAVVPPEQTTPTTTAAAPTTTARGATTAAPTTSTAPQGLVSWPSGRSGYTVVVASVPVTAGRSSAVANAHRALAAGLASVGVLESSQYSSLHPGYYVVFSGIYGSAAEAARAVSAARSAGFANPYARQITT